VYAIAVALVAAIVWYFFSRPKEAWEINPCDWVNQISSGVNKDILDPINNVLDKMPPVMKQRLLKDQVKNTYACPDGTIPEGDKCRVPCADGSTFSPSDKTCEIRVYPEDYNNLKQQLVDINTSYVKAQRDLEPTMAYFRQLNQESSDLQNKITTTQTQINTIHSQLKEKVDLLAKYNSILTPEQVKYWIHSQNNNLADESFLAVPSDDQIKAEITRQVADLPNVQAQYINTLRNDMQLAIDKVVQSCKDEQVVQKSIINDEIGRETKTLQAMQQNPDYPPKLLQEQQKKISDLQTKRDNLPFSAQCQQRVNATTIEQNTNFVNKSSQVSQSLPRISNDLRNSIPGLLQIAQDRRNYWQQVLNQADANLESQGLDPTQLQKQLQDLETQLPTLTSQLSNLTQRVIPSVQSRIETDQNIIKNFTDQTKNLETKINNYDGLPAITKTPAVYKDKVVASSHVDINIQMLPNSIVNNCNVEAKDLKRQQATSFCSSPGYSYTQGACYPSCPDGYIRFGVNCKKPCLDGYTQDFAGNCWVNNSNGRSRIPKECPSDMYQSTDAGDLSYCAKREPMWRDISKDLGDWQCAKDETYNNCYRQTPVTYTWGAKGAGCNGPQQDPTYWFGVKEWGVNGYNDCYKWGGECVAGCQYLGHIIGSDRLLSQVGTCPSNFPYSYGAYCYDKPFNGTSYTPETKSSPGNLEYTQKCDPGYTLTGVKGAQWCTEDCPGGTAVDFGAFATCFRVPKF
jgi:peptidoglycan hydrolase CwlO-like protein